MYVIRDGHRCKSALRFNLVHRCGELVIGNADVGALILAARLVRRFPPTAPAFEANMLQQRLCRVVHVRNFVHRHEQFIVRAIAGYFQLTGAHAHHVRAQRQATQQPPKPFHPCTFTATTSRLRARCNRTKSTRSVANTGTEKNMPATPPICSPASTPNRTSTGLSSTPFPMT